MKKLKAMEMDILDSCKFKRLERIKTEEPLEGDEVKTEDLPDMPPLEGDKVKSEPEETIAERVELNSLKSKK